MRNAIDPIARPRSSTNRRSAGIFRTTSNACNGINHLHTTTTLIKRLRTFTAHRIGRDAPLWVGRTVF
ncbi:hypothetical protein D3C72_2560240 [compost metagenome]